MTAPAWRATLKRRIAAVAGALALWVTGIEARLVYLQVVSHADLVARAERQQKRTQEMPAMRGDILDRRGRVLATSVDADSIYAVPTEIGDAGQAAAKLCAALGDCSRKDRLALAERLNQQRAFAYVRRQVAPDVAKRVADLNLDGIGFLKESKRFYPNRELAAHLLGWVGIDNTGLSGLEYTYDPYIRGKKGTILIQTDARRHAFSHVERPPTAGSTVELTIDENLQHIAERELHIGVVENHALSGSAIIMNPHTGEILAMANEPTFNPNAFRDADEDTRRNRAVQDLYEPGSTFKIVTVSAALEERVMKPDSIIDTNPGSIRLGSRVVTEARHHNYGVLSLSDVIVRSSNVGAIKIGFRVGTERLGRFVQRFGFGRPTSSDFPGESSGIVWDPAKWTDSALMSVSMGYQVGVTPLQMAAAFSSVANGGELMEPRVIRAVYRDNRRLPVRPKVVRRAIAQDTAAALVGIMEGVVENDHGTARAARIPGYSIAGKTGTANKLVNGHYSNDTFASFAGFLPSRNPALTIVVVLDSPRGANGHFGGGVSAPIFKRIAEASLRYLGVPPDVNPAPPVLVAKHDAPDPSAPAPRLALVTDAQSGTIPDVRGMSARDAVRTLFKVGLHAHISGDGIVVSQMPAPGSPIAANTVCRLSLERAGARRAADQVQP